jgi:hypothetical protein
MLRRIPPHFSAFLHIVVPAFLIEFISSFMRYNFSVAKFFRWPP